MKPLLVIVASLLLLVGCDRFTSVEVRIARAEAKLSAGEHQAALIEIRKALGSNPDNLDAQLLLVDILAASGDARAALAQLERSIAEGASPAQTEARRIKLLLTLNDTENARQALDSSSALREDERHTFAGRLLLAQQRFAEAQASFERALQISPDFIDASLGRIEALAAQGQRNKAIESLDELLEAHPEAARAWLLKGHLAAQSGDFAAASDAFGTAIEHGKSLDRDSLFIAHAQYIESMLGTGELDRARKALASFEATAGSVPLVSLLRAKLLLANHDTAAAVNELRRFTNAAPRHLPGRLLLASALLQQGSTEQAFAEAVRNVAEFGEHDEPRIALAGIELSMGRFANAEQTLQPLILRSPPNPLAVAMLAELRIRRGESVAGVTLLEQSVAQNPENGRLRLQLAAAYLSAGEAKQALAALESVKDSQFAPARDRLRIVATATLNGSSAGEQELNAAIARHPDDVDLLLMAATYYANLSQFDRARSYMERVREARPDDPLLALSLGRLELASGRPDQAEELANFVLDKAPGDAAAMTLMANIAAYRGDDNDVDAWLNRARVAKPDALEVSIALAQRALARGNNTAAQTILSEAVRNAPADPRARIALAELYTRAGKHKEALTEIGMAAKEHPHSPVVLLAAARAQLASKDVDAARRSLEQALEVAPGWFPAASTLVALESSVGNLAAALRVAQRLGSADRQGANALALEGQAYMAAKRPADAARAFAAAYGRVPSFTLAALAARAKSAANMSRPEAELQDWIARSPSDSLARRTLAELLMARGENEAAIKHLESVVEASPDDFIALNNLAWLYQRNNDPRAVRIAEQAYTRASQNAAIVDTYGWILLRNNQVERGVEILQKAAELAPQNAEIQYHLAHALADSGEAEKAAALLRRLLESGQAFAARAEAQQLLTKLER